MTSSQTATIGNQWEPPAFHHAMIQAERSCPEAQNGQAENIIARMARQTPPVLGEIDWDAELSAFERIDYPEYYLLPFHSIPGGWLTKMAPLGDRCAMESYLEGEHPLKSLGLRAEIAKLFPEDARLVVDLGAGTGDSTAAIARRLPNATLIAVEASPFMIIVGRRQNKDTANVRWQLGLAEETGLPDGSVDAINMTYLLHECPDQVKAEILAECMRILKPGGMIVFSDALNDEPANKRGILEPFREEWLRVNPVRLLTDAGFVGVEDRSVSKVLWTKIGFKRPA
jgi:SAM-dependent methyltransferase